MSPRSICRILTVYRRNALYFLEIEQKQDKYIDLDAVVRELGLEIRLFIYPSISTYLVHAELTKGSRK